MVDADRVQGYAEQMAARQEEQGELGSPVVPPGHRLRRRQWRPDDWTQDPWPDPAADWELED